MTKRILTEDQKKHHKHLCRIYEKTPKGYAMRMYRNMQSRVTGVQKKKSHLYQNLTILSREDFYDWILNNPRFVELFDKYKSNNFPRSLAPSVDRIDNEIGYEINNMRIVTHGDNSRDTSSTRYFEINGERYNSIRDVCNKFNFRRETFHRLLTNPDMWADFGIVSITELSKKEFLNV